MTNPGRAKKRPLQKQSAADEEGHAGQESVEAGLGGGAVVVVAAVGGLGGGGGIGGGGGGAAAAGDRREGGGGAALGSAVRLLAVRGRGGGGSVAVGRGGGGAVAELVEAGGDDDIEHELAETGHDRLGGALELGLVAHAVRGPNFAVELVLGEIELAIDVVDAERISASRAILGTWDIGA